MFPRKEPRPGSIADEMRKRRGATWGVIRLTGTARRRTYFEERFFNSKRISGLNATKRAPTEIGSP